MNKLEQFLGSEEYNHWQLDENKVACVGCKFASFSVVHSQKDKAIGINKIIRRELICECKSKFNAIKFHRIENITKKVDENDVLEREIDVFSFDDNTKTIVKCMEFQPSENNELDLD